MLRCSWLEAYHHWNKQQVYFLWNFLLFSCHRSYSFFPFIYNIFNLVMKLTNAFISFEVNTLQHHFAARYKFFIPFNVLIFVSRFSFLCLQFERFFKILLVSLYTKTKNAHIFYIFFRLFYVKIAQVINTTSKR